MPTRGKIKVGFNPQHKGSSLDTASLAKERLGTGNYVLAVPGAVWNSALFWEMGLA